jgi:hypothetical protein
LNVGHITRIEEKKSLEWSGTDYEIFSSLASTTNVINNKNQTMHFVGGMIFYDDSMWAIKKFFLEDSLKSQFSCISLNLGCYCSWSLRNEYEDILKIHRNRQHKRSTSRFSIQRHNWKRIWRWGALFGVKLLFHKNI